MKQLLKRFCNSVNSKKINNLKHKLKNAIQLASQQELEAQEQPKKSPYFDIFKCKNK